MGACRLLRDYLEEALKEAQAAFDEGEIPVGAVVVKDGRIVARAHNERETAHDPTAHAELLALRRAGEALLDWRLDGCTLFVTLEPCPMCAAAIAASRLDRLVFGAPDRERGACGSRWNLLAEVGAGRAIEVTGGVAQEACESLLRRFFLTRRGV